MDCTDTDLFGPDGELVEGSSGRRGKRRSLRAVIRAFNEPTPPADWKLDFLQARLKQIEEAEAVW